MNTFERRVIAKLNRLLELQGISIMTLEELASALDAETTAVAAKIDQLRADLAAAVAAGQAPKPETIAALEAVSERLKGLAVDPQNPVP